MIQIVRQSQNQAHNMIAGLLGRPGNFNLYWHMVPLVGELGSPAGKWQLAVERFDRL